MALRFLYSDPRGIEESAVTTELVDLVRFGTLSVTESADLGEPSGSTVELDDPSGAYSFAGLRRFTVKETSAPSNNQIVYPGVIQDRHVSRFGSMLTGSARRWSIDLVDYNWVLSKRVLVDHDSKRPDETAGDRLRWLLASAAHINLNDYGHVTYPTNNVDEFDFRGMRASDVLADCAVERGYTFWAQLNEAHDAPELFFLNPNGSDYSSTLRISNDYADYDGTTTFVPYEDAVLHRSANSIAYGVYLAYENGSVYVRSDTTGDQFAKIDQTAPMATVKHAARARRIANRFLSDNSEEDDRINVSIKVPVAQVNDIRVGHRLEVKFTHLPGYEDFVWMRVLRRTVQQEEEGGGHRGSTHTEAYYRIVLELTGTGLAAASCSSSLSGAVTASVDSQAYDAHTAHLAITPTAGEDSVLIGGFMVNNVNTPTDVDFVATGANTLVYENNVFGGNPLGAMVYQAVTGASGSYTLSGSYTRGCCTDSDSEWCAVAASLRTSATAPVQSVGSRGSGVNTATFASPPTPGNMIVMLVVPRADTVTLELSPTTGWTTLATATINLAHGPMGIATLVARCVVQGDGSTYGGGQAGGGHEAVTVLTEWEMS